MVEFRTKRPFKTDFGTVIPEIKYNAGFKQGDDSFTVSIGFIPKK